jgi:hypothetical protein
MALHRGSGCSATSFWKVVSGELPTPGDHVQYGSIIEISNTSDYEFRFSGQILR